MVVFVLGRGKGLGETGARLRVGLLINGAQVALYHAHRDTKLLGDLFEQNISEATVVTLYLLPSLNSKLIPKFKAELKPGTRIVSQSFDMKPWEPDQQIEVDGRPVFLWIVK